MAIRWAPLAAELQRANEANAVPRGAVQDRPMLSAVHGVEGHYTKITYYRRGTDPRQGRRIPG